MKKVVWTLTLECTVEGNEFPHSRMIVKANTKEEAVKGLQKIFTGEIKGSDIPKHGLDLTKKDNEKTT